MNTIIKLNEEIEEFYIFGRLNNQQFLRSRFMLNVFNYLNFNTLGRCCIVSKKWKKLIYSHPELWRRIDLNKRNQISFNYLNGWINKLKLQDESRLSEAQPIVAKLDWALITSQKLKLIMDNILDFDKLSLVGVNYLNLEILSNYNLLCIKILDLSYTNMTDDLLEKIMINNSGEFYIARISNLISLILAGNLITNEALKIIQSLYVTRIKKINLNCCSLITEVGIGELKSFNLTHLSVAGNLNLTNNCLLYFWNSFYYGSLKYLDIRSTQMTIRNADELNYYLDYKVATNKNDKILAMNLKKKEVIITQISILNNK